jgi:hypothetical protein
VALVTTLGKLRLAATTWGTNDIFFHWTDFSAYVRRLGPIGIYNTRKIGFFAPVPYNHPPLIGWMLVVINWLVDHGMSLRFLIRVPASISDIATAVLVFELVRMRRSLAEATAAGLVVALSPVLVVISGFHGNTDPVFVMFTLLSAYLILHDRPLLAGASAATAISIKLVPVVALPALFVSARHDRRRFTSMAVGFAAVFVPLWGPVVLSQWTGYKRNVLEYKGVDPKQGPWGIVSFARHAHLTSLIPLLIGPSRFLVLAISALLPAYFVWKRRDTVATAAALSLTLFLLLTTTFGMQYLAWAAAVVLLLDVWAGAAFNAAAGLFVLIVYNNWTDGFPWNRALARPLTVEQQNIGWVVWTILFACAVLGVRRLWLWSQERRPPRPAVAPATDAARGVAPYATNGATVPTRS